MTNPYLEKVAERQQQSTSSLSIGAGGLGAAAGMLGHAHATDTQLKLTNRRDRLWSSMLDRDSRYGSHFLDSVANGDGKHTFWSKKIKELPGKADAASNKIDAAITKLQKFKKIGKYFAGASLTGGLVGAAISHNRSSDN